MPFEPRQGDHLFTGAPALHNRAGITARFPSSENANGKFGHRHLQPRPISLSSSERHITRASMRPRSTGDEMRANIALEHEIELH
jgi:hypothetical protein